MTDFTDKKLMENQINKIFSIVENQDNQEILKIAIETLSNKCYENKSFFYIILKNIIDSARKGNLKMIQETRILFDSLLEEYGEEYVGKLFNCSIFREQLENLIQSNENIFSINFDSNFENIYSTDFMSFDFLDKLNLNQLENLYSDKCEDEMLIDDNASKSSHPTNALPFSLSEMEILFPDKNEFKEEIMESLTKTRKDQIMNKRINLGNKIKNKISDFCQNKIINLDLENYFGNTKSIKKRRIENSNIILNSNDNDTDLLIKEIYFNPLHFIMKELIELNSHPYWKTRLCSITILNYLKDYLNDSFFSYFKITIFYNKNKIVEDLKVTQLNIDQSVFNLNLSEISIKMRESLISRLLLNSLLDKVVDFNQLDNICIFKELNIKFLINVLNDEESKLRLNSKIVNLLEILIENYDNSDWQPIYSILIYIKDILNENDNVNSKDQLKLKLFQIICKIMNIDSEEILNLTIQILDKMLEKKTIIHYINSDKMTSIFTNFLKLIDKYDDLEIGVKYYFNCLYNFIIYFKSTDEVKNFQQLTSIIENELIYFSLNKINCVRIKYFEVINNLLDCKEFIFSRQFIENNIFVAFQGLCMEEDKNLLIVQKHFLEKIIIKDEYIDFFFTNSKKFLKLMLKENITNLKYFYIPHSEKYERKEMQMVYSAFFKNDMETEAVKINYERKMKYLTPILALIMRQRIEFTKILLNSLKIEINPNNFAISKEFYIVLKIYFYYLESIEMSSNKSFIFNDELLKKLYDNISLNEISVRLSRRDVENFSIKFKIFLDYINKQFCLVHEIQPFITHLTLIYTNLNDKNLIKTCELLDVLKNMFEKIKENKNDENFASVCEHFRSLKNYINNIENSNQIIKTRIRGIAAVCSFIHAYYSNIKIEKCTTIVHPILNCLKENNKESKIFAKYLIKLLFTVNNLETVNKILYSLLDYSIILYKQDVLESTNYCRGDFIAFLPIKYFFKEFAKYERFNDITRILNEYKSSICQAVLNNISLKNNNEISCEKKIIILLYMITFINKKLNAFDFQTFYKFIKEKDDFNDEKYLVSIISTILLKYNTIFNENENPNLILSTIFTDINTISNDKKIEFLFKIVEELLNDQKFLVSCSRHLLEILKFINYKIKNIKTIATSIFSKIMKTVSVIKMDKEYEEVISNDNLNNSSQLMNTLLNQKIDDKLSCNFLNVNLKENLRHYQITGINWLIFLGNFNLGVALCDDMGLGKTIQTLVCIVNETKIYQQKFKKNPINLIICPNTLILNWVNEGKKFFDEKDVKITRIENEFIPPHQKKTQQVEIFVTSYDKVRERDLFESYEIFYIVLDEAHIVKNPKTKCYQNIRKINSERRIILTGTPIQNNVMELWALFDFLMPGFLGDENDFEIKYHKKIHSNIKKLNLEEKLQENIFQTSLLEIRKRVKPFIMRRLKQDVLKELPDKIIVDYICEMTNEQEQLYNYWEKIYNNKEVKVVKKKKNTKNNLNNSDQNNTLKVIDCLRKICNYPGLLLKDEKFFSTPGLNKMSKESLTNFYSSGKLKSLEDLLISLGFVNSENSEISDTNPENKILIFSQYKTMVEVISDFLKFSFPQLRSMKITSDLSNEERINYVNQFNSDPTINTLILTTSIGGLGLSLTSANIVIMFDHDWNPMRDLQAMDRAHRIGQKKTVEVFRLITADSIEEKLISLQTFKKYIANNVVDETKIHETNINVNNFMVSLEEFSQNPQNKTKISKKLINTKKKNINNINDDLDKKLDEEIELEYLKRFI